MAMTTLITNHELAQLSLHELQRLYRKVFNDLAQSQPGMPERRNALASLENIQRELNRRYSPSGIREGVCRPILNT